MQQDDLLRFAADFYRAGGSDKHLRDIAGVLKISGGEVDRQYVAEWAERLGVAEIWHDLAQRVPAEDSQR
jgi:hypothetical protein